MKDFAKMVIAIVLFATVACVGLAFVYTGTKEKIDENRQASLTAALKEIFPDASEFTPPPTGCGTPVDAGVTFSSAWLAMSNSKTVGVAIQAAATGFNDKIVAIVGVGADGKIAGVRILQDTDTPGLGANAASPSYFIDKPANTTTFYGQFAGKSAKAPVKVAKDGGDIAAITAATITSRAVSLLVNSAAKAGLELLGGAK